MNSGVKLPLRRTRGDEPVLPLALLDGLAAALDRYASVLRAAAEAGGATERGRVQTLSSTLVGIARLRFYLDGAVSDADADAESDPGIGSDWLSGALRPLRIAAAAVVSDARASERAWPPVPEVASEGGALIGTHEAATWLIKLGRVCHEFATRLYNTTTPSAQPRRAAACASLAAELAAHATRMLQRLEDQAPSVEEQEGEAASPTPASRTQPQTTVGTPLLQRTLQQARATVNGGGTGAGVTALGATGAGGMDYGLETGLSLLCAMKRMEAHCLTHASGAGAASNGESGDRRLERRHRVAEALAVALSARCRLERRESSADGEASVTSYQGGGLTNRRLPMSRTQGGTALPSVLELVEKHASARAMCIVEAVEQATAGEGQQQKQQKQLETPAPKKQPEGKKAKKGAAATTSSSAPETVDLLTPPEGASAVVLVLSVLDGGGAGQGGSLPAETLMSQLASVAIAEVHELGCHATKARSELGGQRLVEEAESCAGAALQAIIAVASSSSAAAGRSDAGERAAASPPAVERARVHLALAELYAMRRGKGTPACEASAREALGLVAPLCEAIHAEAADGGGGGNGIVGGGSGRDGSGGTTNAIDAASMKVADLREELGKRGLSTEGTKPKLLQRLQDALEQDDKVPGACASGGLAQRAGQAAGAVTDAALAALELYARARLQLSIASLAALPPPPKPAPPSEPATQNGSSAHPATELADASWLLLPMEAALADAKACGASSAAAADEADASLRAWQALLGPEWGAERAAALRRVLPDPSRTVRAVLRCASILWNSLRDSSAESAARLAAAAAEALVAPMSGASELPVNAGAGLGSARLSDAAEACLSRMRFAQGDLVAAYDGLLAAADRSGSAEPRRVVFDDVEAPRPATSPALDAALAAVELVREGRKAAGEAAGEDGSEDGSADGGVDGGADGGAAPRSLESRLEAAVASLRRQGALVEASHGLVALARAAREGGRPLAAMRHGTEALRLVTDASLGVGLGGVSGGGDDSAAACDALLMISELWMARACWVEARKYGRLALEIGRSTALPRLLLRALLSHAALYASAGKVLEAEVGLNAAEEVFAAHAPGVMTGDPAAASAVSFSASLHAVRLHAARSEALLMPGADQPLEGASTAEQGARALQHAMQAQRLLDSGGACSWPVGSVAAAAERAVVLLRIGSAQRATKATDDACTTLEEACNLLRSSPEAVRWLGSREGGGPALTAEAYLQLGLAHLDAASLPSDGSLARLWSPQPSAAATVAAAAAAPAAAAPIVAARVALARALHAARRGALPATLQHICSAVAWCCGPAHAAPGSRLLASSIGVGVRHVMSVLSQTSAPDGGGGKRGGECGGERGGDAGHGVEAEAEDFEDGSAIDLASAALAALSLATEGIDGLDGGLQPPNKPSKASKAKGGAVKAKAGGGKGAAAEPGDAAAKVRVAEEEWARSLECRLLPEFGGATASEEPSLDAWMQDPPEGCAVCALALPPGGRGLLVSRWTAGAPPVLTFVPPPSSASAGAATDDPRSCEGADLAAGLLADLMGVLREGREWGPGSAVGEGDRAALAAPNASAAIAQAAGMETPAASRAVAKLQAGGAATGRAAKAGSTGGSTGGERGASAGLARAWLEPVAELPDFATIELDGSVPAITLGNEAACGVGRIRAAPVSRKHCRIELDTACGVLTITDSSSNGTLVDGKPIKRGEPVRLHAGALVSLVAASAEQSKDKYDAKLPVYRVQTEAASDQSGAPGRAAEATPAATPGAQAAPGAEKQGSLEKQERANYWARREALDARLGALSERMQSSLLGAAGCLLVPPAAEPAEREALAELGKWAVARTAAQSQAVNEGLLRAACDALPCLSDEALSKAVGAAVAAAADGTPLPQPALDELTDALKAEWQRLAAKVAKKKGKGGGAAATKVREDESPRPGERRQPLVLLLDTPLGQLPWESVPLLRSLPVCRLPCAAFLGRCEDARESMQRRDAGSGAVGVPSGSAYYVLDPASNLGRTQAAFRELFARPPWEGVCGEAPPASALTSALATKDLYVFCGHGNGNAYLPVETLVRMSRCSATLLMGCSSGALVPHGSLAPTGTALAYMHARCPALVANLWDVTDGESDKFCEALLDRCVEQGGSLLEAVAKARGKCRLPFLTGAAAVTYGVPLDFLPRGAKVVNKANKAR